MAIDVSNYKLVFTAAGNYASIGSGSNMLKFRVMRYLYAQDMPSIEKYGLVLKQYIECSAIPVNSTYTLSTNFFGNITLSKVGTILVTDNAYTADYGTTRNFAYIFAQYISPSGSVCKSQAANISYTVPYPTYSISFNTGDGTSVSSATKTWGTTLTLPTDEPAKDGHTFLGWSTTENSVFVNYSPGASFDINAATTLHAIYRSNENNKGIRLSLSGIYASKFMNEPNADKIKLYVNRTLSAKTYESLESGSNIIKLYPSSGKIAGVDFLY